MMRCSGLTWDVVRTDSEKGVGVEWGKMCTKRNSLRRKEDRGASKESERQDERVGYQNQMRGIL